MRKVKHSKFRNTGLLYEFLLRQITTEILDKDSKENATKIVKDYFNENTHLGRELNLYSLLMQRKFKMNWAGILVNHLKQELKRL